MPIHTVVEGCLIRALTSNEVEMIVHGCNCFNTWGAGIALAIKNIIPEAYVVDCNTTHGDENKLGTYSTYTYTAANETKTTVINMYTQFTTGSGLQVDYDAIKRGFEQLDIDYRDSLATIGIPKIGSGLAGGDWVTIEDIINKATPHLDITLYVI